MSKPKMAEVASQMVRPVRSAGIQSRVGTRTPIHKHTRLRARPQVNLPEHMVTSVKGKIDMYNEGASAGAEEASGTSEERQHPAVDTFDEARIEIFELMEKGAFYR